MGVWVDTLKPITIIIIFLYYRYEFKKPQNNLYKTSKLESYIQTDKGTNKLLRKD